MSALVVRAVAEGDFDAWKPLWDGYNTFYGRHGATALPDEITRMTWARFFDPIEPVHALVAERDGQLVGLSHYLFHRNTIAIGLSCYLQDLFTAQAARGQGVGRVLIEGTRERAATAGATRLYWHTYETNHTAMKLYDQVADKPGIVVYRMGL